MNNIFFCLGRCKRTKCSHKYIFSESNTDSTDSQDKSIILQETKTSKGNSPSRKKRNISSLTTQDTHNYSNSFQQQQQQQQQQQIYNQKYYHENLELLGMMFDKEQVDILSNDPELMQLVSYFHNDQINYLIKQLDNQSQIMNCSRCLHCGECYCEAKLEKQQLQYHLCSYAEVAMSLIIIILEQWKLGTTDLIVVRYNNFAQIYLNSFDNRRVSNMVNSNPYYYFYFYQYLLSNKIINKNKLSHRLCQKFISTQYSSNIYLNAWKCWIMANGIQNYDRWLQNQFQFYTQYQKQQQVQQQQQQDYLIEIIEQMIEVDNSSVDLLILQTMRMLVDLNDVVDSLINRQSLYFYQQWNAIYLQIVKMKGQDGNGNRIRIISSFQHIQPLLQQ